MERLTPIAANIARSMTEAGLTQKGLALKAGLGETAIRDILKGRSRHPRHDTIQKIADALNCSAAELLGEGQAAAVSDQIMVCGTVQADAWHDEAQWPSELWFPLSLPPDPRYPAAERHGLVVRGNGMDCLYPDGSIVLCLPLDKLGHGLRHATRVVCRRRKGDGKTELSIKEYVEREDGTVWLWPRSTDPHFQQPLQLPSAPAPAAGMTQPFPRQRAAEPSFSLPAENDVVAIEIIAAVVGSYRVE